MIGRSGSMPQHPPASSPLATNESIDSEQLLRAIVDHTNEIIVITDANGVITFENSSVERVLGFVPGERVGRSVFEHAHPDDLPAALERLAAMTTPGATASLTMRFRHKDGTWRYLEAQGRSMLDVPAINGVLCVARDVTERIHLQERLESAERLDSIGRLAGGMAHDFNNLIAVILASAEQLRRRALDDDARAREVDFIVDAADRARELTSKLLTFARRETADPGMVDAPASVLAAEGFLRRLIGESCALSIEMPHSALHVPVSPAQFEQVLMNLAANARDAMPEGGVFTIRLAVWEGAAVRESGFEVAGAGLVVRVAFADTGIGMSKDVAGRVLEPFYTTKKRGKGTGLGLSTVYGIIRGAGGDLRITSAPGRGTMVEVFLPLLGSGGGVTPVPPTPATLRGGNETILIVEDDDDVRLLTTRTLKQMGYRILEASRGHQALDLLASDQTVNLVVTDVIMPQMNGVTLSQEIRKRHPSMPVLFVTGYTPEHVLQRQTLDARTLLLTKPFKREVLLRHVRQMLDIGVA